MQQRQDNPAIYKLYYQYVPVHQVQEAIQKGQKPYAEKQWQEMDEAGFGVGAYSQEEEAVNRNGTYYFKMISMWTGIGDSQQTNPFTADSAGSHGSLSLPMIRRRVVSCQIITSKHCNRL